MRILEEAKAEVAPEALRYTVVFFYIEAQFLERNRHFMTVR